MLSITVFILAGFKFPKTDHNGRVTQAHRRLQTTDLTLYCAVPGAFATYVAPYFGTSFPGVSSTRLETCFCSPGFDPSALDTGNITSLCTDECRPSLSALYSSPEASSGLMGAPIPAFINCACAPGIDLSVLFTDAEPPPSSVGALCASGDCRTVLSAWLQPFVNSDLGCLPTSNFVGCVCSNTSIISAFNAMDEENVSPILPALLTPECSDTLSVFSGTYTCPSPPPPEESNPCFPSSARVTLSNGKTIPVSQLKYGDTILSVTSEGVIGTDIVSRFSHSDARATSALFVTLQFERGGSLELTPNHHLPVGEECCTRLKHANEIVPNDVIWIVDGGKKPHDLERAKVVQVGTTFKDGLYSPVLLHGGFPVVNNVVTAFDSLVKVLAAKHGLRFLEAACTATDTCDTIRTFFFSV